MTRKAVPTKHDVAAEAWRRIVDLMWNRQHVGTGLLRQQGLTFETIAKRLGMSASGAWRRVMRYERELQKQAQPAPRPPRSRE